MGFRLGLGMRSYDALRVPHGALLARVYRTAVGLFCLHTRSLLPTYQVSFDTFAYLVDSIDVEGNLMGLPANVSARRRVSPAMPRGRESILLPVCADMCRYVLVGLFCLYTRSLLPIY